MSDEKIEDLRLVHLRGLRREVLAILEHQQVTAKNVTRLYAHVGSLTDEMRAFRAEAAKEVQTLKSDVLHLEMQNMSRHGETLSLLRKIEGADDPSDLS